MKNLLVLFLYCLSTLTIAQIKTDTIFSGKTVPLFRFCKTSEINKNLNELCEGEKENIANIDAFDNPMYRAMSNLDGINEKANTKIFSKYSMLLISYYCLDIDFIQDVFLYEMHMQDEKDAKAIIIILERLFKDKNFWEDIGTKNWYFVRDKTIVYFVFTRSKDEISPMKKILENRIKEVLKL